jgi:oxygen-independent coproporphyrinogen-3 oxidase
MTLSDLFAKYDVPVPRYTSYPTVPSWRNSPTTGSWIESLNQALAPNTASMAMYVHIPFCESLCTYCGCNTVITRNHDKGRDYIALLFQELEWYRTHAPNLGRRTVRQVHLGGGTPTFLSPDELADLIDGLRDRLALDASVEASIEVDPRVTTLAHLEVLRSRGVTRLSLGVQDIDEEVQRLINRHQPLELTSTMVVAARSLGFESINIDLVYGLPGQTPASARTLADAIVEVGPDRLAVYSFARVPWIKPAQRKFTDEQIPAGADKRRLYEIIRGPLLAAGYLELGLDHFAKPDDPLAVAAAQGRMHRNFMGYTEVKTDVLIGLGVSAISETPDCYHQNDKVITVYERRVRAGELPTLRGHHLTPQEQGQRALIMQLLTESRLDVDDETRLHHAVALDDLAKDGLVVYTGTGVQVTDLGRAFLRNIAAVFDEGLAPAHESPRYSTSI